MNEFMQLAIDKAREGLENGQTPFGAVIVKEGQLVVAAHNVVWATTDITAHAEVNAIRQACIVLNTIDLSGCEIYSTCEPCPMCFSAIHWAKLDRVIFGAEIADAEAAGFHELSISNEKMKLEGGSPVEIVRGYMRMECRELFSLFTSLGKADVY